MNLYRLGVLLKKEMIQGPKNFMFILGIGMPVVLTLIVSVLFGTFFSDRARLGLVDQGSSALSPLLLDNPALIVNTYRSAAEMEDAVGRGASDMGLLLPAGFDEQIVGEEPAQISVYVWGESQMQHRIIASTALIHGVRQVAGQEAPVEVVQMVLGEAASIPWEERLLPLIVLMAVMLAGVMVSSTSLVNEKAHRTLTALTVTPATLAEVYGAKWLLGVVMGVVTAVITLFLNRTLGGQALLLVATLFLGAGLSAAIGVLLGMLVKDMSSLFATIKSIGILLYAPAFLYLFPEVPEWIGRIFPTYYIIHPILEITQNGAGLAEVGLELVILAGLTLIMLGVVGVVSRRQFLGGS